MEGLVLALLAAGAFTAGCFRPKHGWWVFWLYAVVGFVLALLLGMYSGPLFMLLIYGLFGMAAELLVGNRLAKRD